MTKQERAEIRRLLGDYIASEGCSCCQNIDDHKGAADALGKLLKIAKYKDGSGYDFRRYRSLEDSYGS